MTICAAKRAARTGMGLVVATSKSASDDVLAGVCERAGLSVHRGALNDVYSRFIGATAGLGDDAIVVRLTADNVFPDADLIERVVRKLIESQAAYVAPDWPDSGLPYGVSAEAFRLGALRQASPDSADDAEHVTPALRRGNRNACFESGLAFAHLRATVDTLDDYCRVSRVFDGIDDAVAIGWQELCGRLADLPEAPRASVARTVVAGRPQSQLTLGTAQFGMPYGVANTTGMPSPADTARMIHRAIDHGITHIDTARVYADSEARIGTALRGGWRNRVNLITKVQSIEADDAASARCAVDAGIFRSCHALQTDRLDVVLLHSAGTRFIAGGAAWRRLLDLRQEGVIGQLGVSVRSPKELEGVAEDPDIAMIQLPFNVLDKRWNPTVLRGRRDITVHARSVFLQGLLAGAPVSCWPQIASADAGDLVRKLGQLAHELGRRGMADLAVAFVRAHSWIHSLVVGMETDRQLEENLELFATPALDEAEVALVRTRLPRLPDSLIDPARWSAS
jgi:spore coat polysaccharide biosynthesis protein SpsF